MNLDLIDDYFKSGHSLPIVWGHPLTFMAEVGCPNKHVNSVTNSISSL